MIIIIIAIIALIKVEYGVVWSSAYQEEVGDPVHNSLWLLVPAAPQLPLSGLRYGAGKSFLYLPGNLPCNLSRDKIVALQI